jgi:membrane-associated phospholipid phosphatase
VTAEQAAAPELRRLGEPVDRLMGAYALLAGGAFFFQHRPDGWVLLAALHLAAVFVGFGVGPARVAWDALARRWPRTTRTLGDWYPLVLIPALYSELAVLNVAVHGGRFFDPLVLKWEELFFGGQPSREWAAAMPLLPLSELLHAAYLSYYLIIYVPPLVLYLQGRRLEFRQSVFALILVFLVHYLFFIYFPVQGPRYLFPAPTGPIEDGFFYQLAHRVLEAGSSRGAAFPSSHVGVSIAQTLLTWRFIRPLAPATGLLAAGLALGAIYGGFHYATDAVLGAALGVAAVMVALRSFDALERRVLRG